MSRKGKVTVVGAGFYGSTTAQRLAEYDIFTEVVLTDIIEGKPEGLALDMNQSRPIEGFETEIIGVTTTADGSGYDATAGSDAGIDIVSSEYATVAAEQTALENLSEVVADQITARLALYASRSAPAK